MRAWRQVSTAVFLSAMTLLGAACSDPIEKVWQYPSYAASYSSPAMSGNMIVFGTSSGELHAVSKSGSFLWKFPARKEIVASPAIHKDLVLFGSTNHNFYALDQKGKLVWKYPTFDRIKGDPLVVDGVVYFGSYDDHLYALDAETSEVVWAFPPLEKPAGKASDETPPADGAEAEAAATAAKAKEAQARALWPNNDFSYSRPTLTSKGLIVVGNLDGHLYAIDPKTGKLKWRWGDEHVAKAKASITSTVLEHDGKLFFGGNDGKVYAIALSDQAVVWTFETGDEVNSSPLIDENGVLYIGSRDKKLYALDANSGEKKWEFLAGGPILGRPALYQNLLIFGGGEGDGHIYAVDRASGKEFWRYKTGDRVDADAIIDGDRFYISSGDRNLYAFQINRTTN